MGFYTKRSILFAVWVISYQIFGLSESNNLEEAITIKGNEYSKTVCETPTCISAGIYPLSEEYRVIKFINW